MQQRSCLAIRKEQRKGEKRKGEKRKERGRKGEKGKRVIITIYFCDLGLYFPTLPSYFPPSPIPSPIYLSSFLHVSTTPTPSPHLHYHSAPQGEVVCPHFDPCPFSFLTFPFSSFPLPLLLFPHLFTLVPSCTLAPHRTNTFTALP
jgi:hypothetical protein